MSDERMGGINGSARSLCGRPLFICMRSVLNCRGSRIQHLLSGGSINLSGWRNYDVFQCVIRRLLRDGPMDGGAFKKAVRAAQRRYNLSSNGEGAKFCGLAHWVIGDVKLIEGEIIFASDYRVAKARDAEFEKPKYKKMIGEQVEFLKSVFELTAYSKQLLKDQKDGYQTNRYIS